MGEQAVQKDTAQETDEAVMSSLDPLEHGDSQKLSAPIF